MDPIALESPAGSRSTGSSSNDLQSNLMDESNISVTPRRNTIPSTKGRTLAFGNVASRFCETSGEEMLTFHFVICLATSPTSPNPSGSDINRSIMRHETKTDGDGRYSTPVDDKTSEKMALESAVIATVSSHDTTRSGQSHANSPQQSTSSDSTSQVVS